MLKRLTIGQKLFGALGLVGIFILSLMSYEVSKISHLDEITTVMAENLLPSVSYAGTMQKTLQSARRSQLAATIYFYKGNQPEIISRKEQVKNLQLTYNAAAQNYLALDFNSPEEEAVFHELNKMGKEYLASLESYYNAMIRNDTHQVDMIFSDITSINNVLQLADKLDDINVRVGHTLNDESELVYYSAMRNSTILGIVCIIFMLFVLRYLNSQIKTPINALLTIVDAVSNGDLTKTVKLQEFNLDEIGMLASGISKMQNNLHKLVSEVSGSIVQLSSSAEEISAVAKLSAESMNKQQNELHQLATAMNEMQATVKEVSRNTSDAANTATLVSRSAEHGSETVINTIASIESVAESIEKTALVINQLDENSHNVGVVLDVIQGIAEQTNLLALNAAIEAARAGEQGRGFAVVADEVRTLAKQTQDSTTKINTIIQELQQRASHAGHTMQLSQAIVHDTVEKAQEAGTVIANIRLATNEISQMSTQIATATEEQEVVSEELNRNISNISVAAEDVSAGANQMSQACDELTRLASQLQGLIGSFRT
ncbi:MAG: methyl-accepting chemotaxis protein [Aeromonas popoffii]|uniref:methyl-accepting chemotaxis protein n=1 Tax=Aeromonas TaxID=642 RepID=UPI0023DE06D2|nr:MULTISPECIES: methyl-accepting chemotaxis protein [unclassified Aeromonas]MDF2415649.1 HAMP domain-containing protein [Aeromonas sp. 1HA1]